jgi:hypothetical protein
MAKRNIAIEAQRKCQTCGVVMKRHPVCAACGILCGPRHLETLTVDYRGHKMCYHCKNDWLRLDRIVGRETTWEEFVSRKEADDDHNHDLGD